MSDTMVFENNRLLWYALMKLLDPSIQLDSMLSLDFLSFMLFLIWSSLTAII